MVSKLGMSKKVFVTQLFLFYLCPLNYAVMFSFVATLHRIG